MTISVENSGFRAGAEVVQLYISPCKAPVERPVRELRGFEKIYLEPKEKKSVKFSLSRRDFAYWDVVESDWYVPSGEYKIQICKNSSEVVLEIPVSVESAARKGMHITRDTAIGDLSEEQIAIVMAPFISRNGGSVGDKSVSKRASNSLQMNMPLRSLVAFGAMDEISLQNLLCKLNRA